MATVHLARQLGAAGFARMVAVKRLHERFSRDPEFVGMFLDEARIVARIRHPNVVQTVDVVAENGELFLVMEYIHGESLVRLVASANRAGTRVPIGVIAAVLCDSLRGLHEAHEACGETGEPLGIVHRDVSPQNILVGADGIARVLDFGVAKASQRIQTTQTGQLKGKLSYMAPEQVTNGPLDRRTDVYAAAVVLWEALTGAKLFHGDSEAAVLNQILLESPRAPSRINRDVPPELDAVVLRGLSRAPEERFASAREMASAIERAVSLATASEVGEELKGQCAKTLSARAQLIASIEARTSTKNLREAVDSLRSLQSARSSPSREMVAVNPAAMSSAPPPVTPGDPRESSAAARGSGSGPVASAPPPFHGSTPPPTSAPVLVASFPPSSGAPGGGGPGAGGTGNGRGIAASGARPGTTDNGARIALAVTAAAGLIALAGGTAGVLLWRQKHARDGAAATSTATTTTTTAATTLDAAGGTTGASVPADAASAAAGAGAAAGAACPDDMAAIPGGGFFMGSDDDLPPEKPAHKVVLRPFCIDKREVTAEAYRACSDRGDCKRAGTTNRWDGMTPKDAKTYDPLCTAQDATRGTHPINCVEWSMADRFCRAAGKRLPTEAEWEFSARGSDGRKYPWGDSPPSPKHLNACGAECVAWGKKRGAFLEAMFTEADPWPTTAPVGSFLAGASAWGVLDIVGNVWEWVADYYGPYAEADQDNPTGPASGATRVMRGGAWNGAYPDWVRPSFRFHASPDTRSHGVGFRCAKSR